MNTMRDRLLGLSLFLLFNHIVYILELPKVLAASTSTFPKKDCKNEIAGVNKTIYVPSNTTIGTRIHVIGWPQKRRKKRQSPTDDIFLATNSSYFDLVESRGYADYWDIVTKACLHEGLEEILAFSVSEVLDPYKYCEEQELIIVIIPTKPVIMDIDAIDIEVENCRSQNILEVHRVTFLNQGGCVFFVCSIKCVNKYKDFWTEKGSLIVTAVESIEFMIVYELEVTCAERQNYWKHELSQQTSVEVTFTKTSACTQYESFPNTSSYTTDVLSTLSATLLRKDNTTTTLLSLPTNLTARPHIQIKSETEMDFFDEQLHVIAVSIFCGSILLVLLFMCLCSLYYRRCFFASVAPRNTVNEDKHDESKSGPRNHV